MKCTRFFGILVVFSGFFSTPWVHSSELLSGLSVETTQILRARLEECLVRPYGIRADASEILGAFRSVCAGTFREGLGAQVELLSEQGRESLFELRLTGSENSDGGDLWDVAIWDSQGHLVLEARDVLAFGDPFEAFVRITGARPQARIHDSSLDQGF